MNILVNAAENGIQAMCMSDESSEEQLARKLVDVGADYDWPILVSDMPKVEALPTVAAEFCSFYIESFVKLIVIDSIQLLKSDEDADLNTALKRLREIAKKMDICIIAVSQSTHDGPKGFEDMIPDNIIEIYRPGIHSKRPKYRSDLNSDAVSEIIIRKGRNIGTGFGYVEYAGEGKLANLE